MVTKITAWLKSAQDYNEGILLLMSYSRNRVLIERLNRKPWPEKLIYELSKISTRSAQVKKGRKLARLIVAPVAKKPQPKTPVLVDKPEILPDPSLSESKFKEKDLSLKHLPKHLKVKYEENVIMYKESRSLHEKLKLLVDATADQRKPVIHRLNMLETKTRKNWNLIDSFDPAELVLDITKAQNYINRHINKCKLSIDNAYGKEIQKSIHIIYKAGGKFTSKRKMRFETLGFQIPSIEK